MTGNEAGSRTKRLLDVIPAGKKINEPSIAAVAKSNVNDLRETAKMHLQQAGIVALDLSQLDEPAIKAEWYDAARQSGNRPDHRKQDRR